MSVWGFIKGFGKLLIGLLLLLQGIVFLAVLLFFVGIAVSIGDGLSGGSKPAISVPQDAALLINPQGVLVEQAEPVDPFEKAIEEAYGVQEDAQIEAGEIIRALRKAKEDKRIKGVVLDIGGLYVPSSSASKLHDIAAELDAFKASGKEIIAVGDYYSQEQYFLAARANEILLNDYGNVVLYGYGSYGTYLKSLLEKLKITSHVFRVGTFKSAIEPFIRDDMSPEAKEANLAFLSVLWDEYAASTDKARGLGDGATKRYADEIGPLLRAASGDFAKVAKDYGLVDALKSRHEQLDYLAEKYGKEKDAEFFKHVTLGAYLSDIGAPEDGDAPNIALVTAAGTIVDGEAPEGAAAGGDTVAKYLKKALEDEDVKAVVLRVDSPGGSAFASEVIRDQVLALKKAGKPVVVSMGSLAASGGYWIAAPADEIFAAPTTITGSIGIFGFFTTFENTAAEAGIFVDGVGTTALSPLLATGIGPLPQEAADLFQLSTEDGYRRFLSVVSEGRGLDPAYVDQIGQGRVWIGKTALDLKLVDKLGTLDDAVASAAGRANLEEYDVVEMTETLTPFEMIFGKMSARAMKLAGLNASEAATRQSALRKVIAKAEEQVRFFDGFNDPAGLYARCLACETK